MRYARSSSPSASGFRRFRAPFNATASVAVGFVGVVRRFFAGAFSAAEPPGAAAAARSVNARAENGDDREEVVGELPLAIVFRRLGVGGGIQRRCVHDDARSATTEHVLETIVCEAAQAVAVGNIQRAYSSRKRGVQKGAQAPAAEVEAAGDVAEDAASGMPRAEGRGLALEGRLLLAGGDAGVDGIVAAERSGVDARRRFGVVVRGRVVEDGGAATGARSVHDGLDVVQAMLAHAVPGEQEAADETGAGPFPDGLSGDTQSPGGGAAAEPFTVIGRHSPHRRIDRVCPFSDSTGGPLKAESTGVNAFGLLLILRLLGFFVSVTASTRTIQKWS